MYKLVIFIALLLTANIVAAQKTSKDDFDEATICIGGPRWVPTIQESHDIKANPVPPSYRSIFEPLARCAYWKEYAPQMVDWQIRFGDAKTAMSALKYIEQRQWNGKIDLSQHAEKLRVSFASARSDIARASKVKQPKNVNYNARYKYLHGQKSVERFDKLQHDRKNFQFLAELYIKAAEEFSDIFLLERGDQFLKPALEGASFLASIEHKPPVKGQFYFNLHGYQLDDLRARIALLRLRLSQSTENLDVARKALQTDKIDLYIELAETAFGGGESFCDIADGSRNSETLAIQCRKENGIHEQVVNQMLNHTIFELYSIGSEDKTSDWRSYYGLADRLLSFEEIPDYSTRCCRRRVDEDRIRLSFARAVSVENKIRSFNGYSNQWEWYETLNSLREVQQLIPAYSEPARFRRIAKKWLQLEQLGMHHFNKGDQKATLNNEMILYKMYLEKMIGGDQ